ncbi:MAG TPA: ribbon-helix-helix domain-containing protein [Chloroflexota bacterium]|jgi:metal-responsive CopG/Arc/MetJ family transcriptional regulator|nr:ribbon-helix-helix domain-containing protein [Chloroflexota bacterium]
MAGSKTRTSITLDRDLFAQADRFSRQLHLSRSEFIEHAIKDFVRVLEERELKDRINAAQAALSDEARTEGQIVTEFSRRAAVRTRERSVDPDTW